MKKTLQTLCLCLFMLALLTAGCGGGKDGKDKKELVVGTEPAFAPFEFQKENSKEYVGFDMDLIAAIAKRMGYEKCTIRGMGFDALIPALEAKNIDVAIAGMTITEERAKKVIFSKPYYKSGLAIVVHIMAHRDAIAAGRGDGDAEGHRPGARRAFDAGQPAAALQPVGRRAEGRPPGPDQNRARTPT